MKVVIRPNIARDARLKVAVERATLFLADEAGSLEGFIGVVWDTPAEDRATPLIELSLKVWTSEVTARFEPEHLARMQTVKIRLRRLLGSCTSAAGTSDFRNQ